MRKMKSMKISLIVLTAIIAFFFLAVMSVSAEVAELWNRTYDGGFNDHAKGVATDASGNVIVTGNSNPDGNDINYYTIKYNPDGYVLWNRTYDSGNSDSAKGVATDASGNVIVTGIYPETEGRWFYNTIKYDADGNKLWSRTYCGYRSYAQGVATDASGNVIVTGYSHGGCTMCTNNYYTIKYNPAGGTLWSKTYDSGFSDIAKGVATDASGNVIVTGNSNLDGSDTNYYTIKYNPDGYKLWGRTYDSGGTDHAKGVATDASGNVIVTGNSNPFGNNTNYYTIKYNPSGYELWSRTL